MDGVLYAAVGAALMLGVAALWISGRRGRGVHSSEPAAAVLRVADAEATALRQVAQTEADSIRRSATAEADALRRAAEADAAASQVLLESSRSRAERDSTDLTTQATRRAEAQLAQASAESARMVAEAEAARRDAADITQRLAAQQRAAATVAAEWDSRREQLDRQATDLDVRANDLAARLVELDEQARALARNRDELAQHEAQALAELSRIAGLSREEAKTEVLASVEAGARREAAVLVRTIESEARAEGTERARAIVVEAVQRVASEQTSESVVSVLTLPAEEMKGRIIGREGRNIRAFESVTGVNVIIDDTPEAVLLSCFDPVRREIGRLTLEKLILDGRIHPHRIEEVYETSKADVEVLCLRAARDALAQVGIADLDEHLLPTLGRLKYRTSYGQNVLGHLLETAHIAGVMAAELGVDPTLVKRAAFLHDIGKALTHEVEGSHAIVGAELLRRYGESETVAHAVEAHHNEVPPRTVEAILTQASDTCSASRPGARRESLETYVKRLARIEEIAQAKDGVEKVFAMQAGREVRVMVQPAEVDDLAAQVIAREIAKQIEDELTYPGQIRVTVVRESRATETAH